MIHSHLLALFLFSALTSAVLAGLHHGAPRAQAVFGVKVFAAFFASALVVGWLMAPFPG